VKHDRRQFHDILGVGGTELRIAARSRSRRSGSTCQAIWRLMGWVALTSWRSPGSRTPTNPIIHPL
jgi:hypothetical protein